MGPLGRDAPAWLLVAWEEERGHTREELDQSEGGKRAQSSKLSQSLIYVSDDICHHSAQRKAESLQGKRDVFHLPGRQRRGQDA